MSIAFLAAALAAAPAPTPGPPPKNAWIIDYAETFCTAARHFGDPEHPLSLVLRPSPRGDLLQLFVIHKGGYAPAMHVPVTVGFTGRSVKATALVYGPKKGDRSIVLTTLGPEAAAVAAETTQISINGGGGVHYDFTVSDMRKVTAALATCNADLLDHWNMGDYGRTRIAKGPRPLKPLASYLSSDDYPAQAIDESATGHARVLLLIDEEGKVRDCLLTETSGNASLDAMTCVALVQRARFEPARDAAGKPLKSDFYQVVNWKIE